MPRPLVIIHGWSDTFASFRDLANLVAARRGTEVSVIALGDYVSMSDYVTFNDLVAGMDKAWTDQQLPRGVGSVDAIVHSTGGLVLRDWMSKSFKAGKAPIKNLVMLAPANFGSPLAHKGRAFYGRVLKGFGNSEGFLQTGTQILKGLELASPYSWNLAQRDRLGDWATSYGPDGVLCTVLVGNRGYDGIRSIANEDGSDGTVRVSTANLNCASIDVDFTRDPMRPTMERTDSHGLTAFRVVDGHNHGSITLNGSSLRSALDQGLFDLIMQALDVTDSQFKNWCKTCSDETTKVMDAGSKRSETQGFQNTVVRVIDSDGAPVTDYLIEFYEEDDDKDLIAKMFHTTAMVDVHAYSGDASYRSIYVNCTKLNKTIDKVDEALRMSITAYPVIGTTAPAGYRTIGDKDIGAVRIPQKQITSFFECNRTLLITIKIAREREDRVFRFNDAGQ